MPSNYKILVNGQLTDTDDVFELRENYPLLVDNFPGGPLYAWGSNDRGALGLNLPSIITGPPPLNIPTTNVISSPTQIGTSTDWKYVTAGDDFSIAIKTNGTLWGWGSNNNGQQGNNDTVDRSSPIQIGADVNWKLGSAAGTTCLVIKTDGTLWGWGLNTFGQLGQNDTISRSSPVQIGTDTNWKRVSIADDTTMVIALKTNGTIWGWGYNVFGTLGQNDTISRSSPVQIGTDNDWSFIEVGDISATYAIKTNGTLWSWGSGNFGQLGHNDIISRSSPVQIGADTNWKYIFSNGSRVFVIKTNGTLWSWGNNGDGELGHNDIISKSSPVQVGTSTDWYKGDAKSFPSAAIKTNGTLWMWGESNISRQNLQSTDPIIDRSSPVQIGSNTNWKEIVFGDAHAHALTY